MKVIRNILLCLVTVFIVLAGQVQAGEDFNVGIDDIDAGIGLFRLLSAFVPASHRH